jgi:small-conductance mechanosensitive channel
MGERELKLDGITSPLISSALIIAVAALGLAVVQFLGKRVLRILQSKEPLREARRQQMITLVQILRWGADVLIVGSALLMLLSTFGVDITPLLASVGVAGLAVSLGAQTLIKDLIGGVLILVENQYAVGDTIQVGNVSGAVERLTLRATYVRDINGYLHVAPNGEVRIVANMSRDWSRALVERVFWVKLDREPRRNAALCRAPYPAALPGCRNIQDILRPVDGTEDRTSWMKATGRHGDRLAGTPLLWGDVLGWILAVEATCD